MMPPNAPKPVLSREQLMALYLEGTYWEVFGRAVERAVLEAVGYRSMSPSCSCFCGQCADAMSADALRARVAELERECASLASITCDAPVAGEHGHKLCGTVEAMRAERDAARRELEEARVRDERLIASVSFHEAARGHRAAFIGEGMRRHFEDAAFAMRAALDRAREGE